MRIFRHSDIRTFGASEHPSVYTFVQYLVTFCLLITSYLLFAFSSLYLPESRIKHAIEKSVVMGDIKTDYPRAIVNKEVCRMDQYSDALILNQAYCASKEKPIRSIMLVPSVGGIDNMAEWLEAATSGVSEPIHTYPRYWHGSTYLSRWVLLLCGRYANLQLFIFYMLSISIFALLLLLIKKKKVGLTICLFISMLLLKTYVSMFSIHLSQSLFIAIITAIAALFIKSKHNRRLLLFIAGSLTAFLDLMTTPMLTLGIPLLVMLADEKNQGNSFWSIIKGIIVISIFWGLGYASTWIFKWILATWLTGTNVIADAISISKYRINGDVSGEIAGASSITVWDSVYANLSKSPLALIMALFLSLSIIACFAFNKKGIKMALAYLIVSLLPIMWYVAISNQTYVHCWFTYRALIVTLAGVLMALASLIDWQRLKNIAQDKLTNGYSDVQMNGCPDGRKTENPSHPKVR